MVDKKDLEKLLGKIMYNRNQTFLTLTVVTEGHLGLAKTNGVLAGADTVKLLELGLLDILNCVIACQQTARENRSRTLDLSVLILVSWAHRCIVPVPGPATGVRRQAATAMIKINCYQGEARTWLGK